MKKIGFIIICSLFLSITPFYVEVKAMDKATSKAGVVIKKDPHKGKSGTDDKTGTFPTKIPQRLPKTGGSSDFTLVFLGIGLILFIGKKHFKGVRKES
ncbi:LPXTG cell wall anchor domain-containing protein [Listeria sp. FSL L7-0091]|uniref:LPXTG cell wall anchor domain-containing protein n=1 Tax=Listeria farberi TaxID=2713500 RepID=A0A7X0ZJM7_9LIST|nr:LPXTG cell wall anchor domain-containing protein [Listeria farberi]MBC1376077.1 LPXTG cell wall anchor domain-containing protein [Listeria farberi]MBC1380306.1 LPXTG cell wall anchor domain-containing protein [Listeria farberi]MBC2260564.1 LPXTG cell wall anchor domain-containing protein [Listeria farberi]MBC2266537.1 LPXTG cell wall anchor domain-containing protein [Listeria farberi]MBC2288413.1 LPXTG cell wall anchor domain-containing protein [Listeria farberi]